MCLRNSSTSNICHPSRFCLLFLTVLQAFVLTLAGCGGAPTASDPVAGRAMATNTLRIEPSSIDFSSQLVGTVSSSQVVTVTNVSSRPLVMRPATVSATGAFKVLEGFSSFELAPSASMSLHVAFMPNSQGSYTGVLQFNFDNQESLRRQIKHIAFLGLDSVPLKGAGVQSSRLTSITISPAWSRVSSGQVQRFTALPSGPMPATINWTARFGVIDSSGTYHAPVVSTFLQDTVSATNAADSNAVATALITVVPLPPQTPQPQPTPQPPSPQPPSPQPPVNSNGPNYYVSPSGNDADDGSFASPWQTINHANAMVQPGAIVHVLPGVYSCVADGASYSSCIATTTSGTSNAWITYISDTPYAAQIVASGNGQTCADQLPTEACNGGTIWANGASYVVIQGFDLDGSGSPLTISHGIVNYMPHVQIVGNRVHDLPLPSKFGAGMNSTSCDITVPAPTLPYTDHNGQQCGDVWAIANTIYNIGTQSGPVIRALDIGIYFSAPFENIIDNVVYNVFGGGWCLDLNHYPYKDIVMNNTLWNCGGMATDGYNIGGGINVSSEDVGTVADYNTVSNNIFANMNGESGITERTAGAGTLGPHNDFNSNLFYGNYNNTWITSSPQPQNSVFANPQFVSPGVDFHLLPGSPAIGTGTTACALTVTKCAPSQDLEGNPIGTPPAIGAYE